MLCILSVLVISGCSQDKKNPQINITENYPMVSTWKALNQEESAPSIIVIDSLNRPIANAQVLIGSAVGSPFKNNLFTTDKNGTITTITGWTIPAHVTADAPGFIRQTLLSQQPGLLTLKLNAVYLPTSAVVTGQVTALPVVDKDKMIDFGLVMSALTRADLLNFDLASVISPINDIMKVSSYEIPVPTNVSLPKQKESYIIGLTIEKPVYRYFSPTLGTRRLYAAAGRFPFKQVVDELRGGKPFYEVINYFDLRGGGFRDVTLNNTTTNLDIPANELSFTKPVSIASPQLNADEIFIGLTASEVSGYMIPTGMKNMASNTTVALNAIDNKPAFTVNVIKKQSEFMASTPGSDRLSASVLPYIANAKPNMLPLVSDPSVTNTNGYVITMPTAPNVAGIYSLAVTAMISDLVVSGPADKPVTEVVRKWEVLGNRWPATIQLPNWPLDQNTNKKRFEVNFVGGTIQQDVDLGNDLVNAATHVTHSSVEF